MSRAMVYWTIYAVIVAALWLAAFKSGIVGALWRIDTYYLTCACVAIYVLAEARLFWRWRGDWDDPFLNDVYEDVRDAAWFCKLLAIFAIAATMAGILIAFFPFLEAGGSIEQMQMHLGQFFGGVTVAVAPAVVAFALWGILEINQQLLTWFAEGKL